MEQIGHAFREWLLRQQVHGVTPRRLDDAHYRLDAGVAIGEVNLYPYRNGREIAEYRIVRASDGEATFFLHVLLDDLDRAKELFGEMAEALVDEAEHTTTHVLLCCTSALTTTLFANKMNDLARSLALDYDFTAMSVERALATDERYAAVLLAPQVSHQRSVLAAAHPDALVFEIPAKIFGSYDAAGALRLLTHALRDVHPSADAFPDTTRVARDLSNDYRILIITLFTMRTYSRLGYHLYDRGVLTARGSVRKPRLDYRDVEDLLETVDGRGVSVSDLDIIGIAVPGVTYHGMVSLPGVIDGTYDLGNRIHERFGIRTSVDNNCNAAAVGCYVGQDRYESIVFYRHEFGHIAGGLGTVIDGTLLKGRRNLAGEPKYYESLFAYDPCYRDQLWSAEGMFEIARNVSLSVISLISPEAIYLAVDTVDDMDELRRALTTAPAGLDQRLHAGLNGGPLLGLPDELIPPLYVVDDYHQRVYLGEYALCLQKLRNPAYRSLGIA